MPTTFGHPVSSLEESGAACLKMAAWILGERTSVSQGIVRRLSSSALLIQAAEQIGFAARVVVCPGDSRRSLSRMAIVRSSSGTFMLFEKQTALGGLKIYDPTTGWSVISRREFASGFEQTAIEIEPTADFKKKRQQPDLSPSSFLSWTPDVRRALYRVVLTTSLTQFYVIAGPLFGGLIVDRVIPDHDTNLLTTLAVVFGLLIVFNGFASALRAIAMQQLSALMGWQMTRRLVSRLIRLPLDWFQTRRQADILQKLASLDQIRALFTSSFTAVAVDGVMLLVSLVALGVLAPVLCLLSLGLLFAYGGVRLVAVPINQRFQARALQATISDNASRMELVRTIQTVKAMAGEDVKEASWSAKFAANVQATLNSGSVFGSFAALQGALTQLFAVGIYFFGARAVIAGDLTVGTLVAAMAYHTQFAARASSLLDQYVAWRMLDVHVARISDLALDEKEPGIEVPMVDYRFKGELELERVTFSYLEGGRPLLSRASLKIAPGEFVALVGPSGIGKSTLIKLLVGLYPAAEGTIKLDGRSLLSWGPRTVRRAIGCVLQNDELLMGTIAENVTFFSDDSDSERVWRALDAAGIGQEVQAMPDREYSRIGDIGATLSGGQKQRLLLARAFYKEPSIFVLDEATSHLDVDRERQILQYLRERLATVLIVAHRPETIAAADRVVRLTSEGLIIEETISRLSA